MKTLIERISGLQQDNVPYHDIEQTILSEFEKTQACLVIDSTGFTRTTQKKGIVHFLSLIATAREIIKEVLDNFSNCKYHFEADNTYALFPNIDEAFKAALLIRESISEANLELYDGENLQVCIGIGFGKLLVCESECAFGDEMNIASKLGEDTADGGDILLSKNAYTNMTKASSYQWESHISNISGAKFKYFQLRSI